MRRAAERAAKTYQGPVTVDRFGRRVPKSAVGSIGLGDFTSSAARIREAMTMLYERIVDARLLVRRLTVVADDVATPKELAAGKRYEQLDLFGDDGDMRYDCDSTESGGDGSGRMPACGDDAAAQTLAREHDIQRALLDVKRKFGRNAVISHGHGRRCHRSGPQPSDRRPSRMTLQETHAYDDIINLPHHQSRKHPHMSRHQRAAQFMPFAALTGYHQVIEQTAKNAETAIAQAEAQGDTDFGA